MFVNISNADQGRGLEHELSRRVAEYRTRMAQYGYRSQ